MEKQDALIVQDLDTKLPISALRNAISKRLHNVDLNKHEIYLQDFRLDPTESLYDQGFKIDGIVELSVEIRSTEESQRLTIVEIVKPAVLMGTSGEASHNTAKLNSNNKKTSANASHEQTEKQSNFSIPGNPLLWNEYQVYKWILWVGKASGYDTSVVKNQHIDGKTLCKLSANEFTRKFPYGQTLYSNLEVLKKFDGHRFVITEDVESTNTEASSVINPSDVQKPVENSSQSSSKISNAEDKGASSSNNGNQIQLWQFLLEILTDADCIDYIRWVGDSGEFKFLNPSKVAQLWGIRKSKPTMNYEKLSRALRYYYDGEILSKVPGKRFVYKFVCDLKDLVGFTAAELNRQVTECAQKRRNVAESQDVDAYLRTPDNNQTNNFISS